eukprot:UN11472
MTFESHSKSFPYIDINMQLMRIPPSRIRPSVLIRFIFEK